MPAVAPKDRARRALPGQSERPRRFGHLEARQLFESGVPTLDERISATWSRLVRDGVATCPVCEGRIDAGQPCRGCGSELS
jgi:hypothetical protein